MQGILGFQVTVVNSAFMLGLSFTSASKRLRARIGVNKAWFNFSIFAGDKSWVAGVGAGDSQRAPSAEASDLGASPSGVDPSYPEV